MIRYPQEARCSLHHLRLIQQRTFVEIDFQGKAPSNQVALQSFLQVGQSHLIQ